MTATIDGQKSANRDSQIRDLLLKNVPVDGTAIGNKSLIATLRKTFKDLNDDDYWRLRNHLIEDGILSKGRGQGGSVYRTKSDSTKQSTSTIKSNLTHERGLYPHFIDYIKNYWVQDNDVVDEYILENTASQGSKKTGGRWSRPDVTVITVKSYQYLYGKIIDVITFEIKPEYGFGVESVFETAAHSMFAHKSFLCIHTPNGEPTSEDFERIKKQCERFGVGLIIFTNPNEWETYSTLIDPERKEPDPNNVNMFIKQQISIANHEKLSKLIK